jgi:hypothetical protein
MFWRGQAISKQILLTLSLYLIGGLHTMIFAIFQIPQNFLLGHTSIDLAFECKIVLYAFAIATSLAHQLLCRKIGLRKTLYMGLLCNIFGLVILMLNQFVGGKAQISFVFLEMMLFGIALTSVINSLITYIILQFPQKVGAGITALFAVFNGGVMLTPILLNLLEKQNADEFLYPFLIVLILLSLWFVHVYFFTPTFPSALEHLRKGSLICKELHYRLALFVVAIIAYGLTETTFSLWGFITVQSTIGTSSANTAISIFWLFLIVGQILLLLPLYFLPAKKLFYFLILIMMGSAMYFPEQNALSGYLRALALAGFGCSAVFPILLSMMEKEMLLFAIGNRLLPFIETAVSVMLAGYFIGVGTVDLLVERFGNKPFVPLSTHFQLAVLFSFITGVCALYLNFTFPKTRV